MGAKKLETQTISLDHQVIKELDFAVTNVFSEFLGLKIKMLSSTSRVNTSVKADVSGVVGLVQDRYEGNLIISFNKAAIFEILSHAYKEPFSEINDRVKDGAAEIANMIYGQLKVKMNARGYYLKMALPNVIVGMQHNIHSVEKTSNFTLDYGCKNITFQVTMSVVEVADPTN